MEICKPNEEFKECGSACPITCLNHTNPRPCHLPCTKGCFCKPGFVRGPNGQCIPPSRCPDECIRPYEEYLECGPPCIRTCSRIDPRRKCPSFCVKGCFCVAGYVRDIDGNCIKPENCPLEPERCPDDEIFYACTPTCGSTCDSLKSDSGRICSKVCRPGCFCRRGFVKTRDGKCVLPQNCPKSDIIKGRRLGYGEDDTTSETPLPTTKPVTTPGYTTTEISTTQTTPPVTSETTPATTVTTASTTTASTTSAATSTATTPSTTYAATSTATTPSDTTVTIPPTTAVTTPKTTIKTKKYRPVTRKIYTTVATTTTKPYY
ncbi:cysteine-rich venom protein 6 [Nephila pilipes]|uniref:Cysteine-rich venom protein 6 n=1 Tax=Nephila pilipes TaxID=299642 RepID=A0A8X6TTN2_NEPPI|nr:cysteine-rich venom protein 6 [Nephila pilipes]